MSYRFVGLQKEHWLQMPEDARPREVEDTTGIVAIRGDGEVQAIAIMDSWSKNSCQIHITIFNPFVLKHGFQEEVFNFIFNVAGRNLIIGTTPTDKPQAIKFNKNMGFEEVFRVKDGCEIGVDYVITEMRKENCKWIVKIPQEMVNE